VTQHVDWFIWANAVKGDALLVSQGRSQYVDGRRLCVECGCPSRDLEDMRCPTCNREPERWRS